MLMYTSCGWFFDELTGPATLQVLQYAARALQLSQQVTGASREEAFLQRAQEAWSNLRECGNGRHVYARYIKPTMLDLIGVAAHYAISSIFYGYHADDSIFCYRVMLERCQVLETGKTRFAAGVACLTSETTDSSVRVGFGVLYFGDHNLSAGVRPVGEDLWFEDFLDQAGEAFSAADLPLCLRLVDRFFHGSTFSLKSLFQDERRRITNRIVETALGDAETLYRRLYEEHAPLMSFLSELRLPLPPVLQLTSEYVLASAVRRTLADEKTDLDVVRSLIDTARRSGFTLDPRSLESALRQRLNALVERWMREPGNTRILEEVENLVALSRLHPFELNLWKSQNAYYELSQAIAGNGHGILTEAWLNHFLGLGKWLGLALPQLPDAPLRAETDPAA
jgi:hypothetical protein